MFISTFLTVDKIWKQQRYLSVSEWIKNYGLSISNAMKYYTVLKNSEPLSPEKTPE